MNLMEPHWFTTPNHRFVDGGTSLVRGHAGVIQFDGCVAIITGANGVEGMKAYR